MSNGPAKAPRTRVAPTRNTGFDTAKLMHLESDLRNQTSSQNLAFHLVNALPQCVNAEQAIAFRWAGSGVRPTAASNVPKPNPDSAWVQGIGAKVAALSSADRKTAARIDLQAGPSDALANLPFGLYVPIPQTPGKAPDLVVLARAQAWQDAEITLASYLGEVYAHSFQRSTSGSSDWVSALRRRIGWVLLAVLLAALVFVRVPTFTVAPARVIANSPIAIAPSTSGQIQNIAVRAGQDVTKGTILVQLDARVAEAQLASARQALLVAEIREAQLRNMALRQPQARADLLLAEAEVAQARIDVEQAQMTLDFHTITAPSDGRVIGERLDRLAGRPVAFGDVLFTLADPEDVQLSADVAITDSAFVYDLATARFFANDAPLNPLELRLKDQTPTPDLNARGSVSYALKLDFVAADQKPQIGAEGIAQLTGEEAALGYVLLRKPIAWVLQRLPANWVTWLWSDERNG